MQAGGRLRLSSTKSIIKNCQEVTMNCLTLSRTQKCFPVITFLIASGSLLISCTSLSHMLQYDREAIACGQLWLIITGHLSHWSLDNLLWDLLVFVILGGIAERLSRLGFTLCLLISSLLISTVLWFGQQDIDCYRGLSGLDSALFSFIALLMVKERIGHRDYRSAAFILLASVAFLLKIVYEAFTLQTVFSSSAGLFTPVPLAHMTGGVVGIGVALLFRESPRAVGGDECVEPSPLRLT